MKKKHLRGIFDKILNKKTIWLKPQKYTPENSKYIKEVNRRCSEMPDKLSLYEESVVID